MELRVLKRGLTGTSSGKREIGGKKSKERETELQGLEPEVPPLAISPAPTHLRNETARGSWRGQTDDNQKDFEKFLLREMGWN